MTRKKLETSWIERHPIRYRAIYLISAYNQNDESRGRGIGDLTIDWFIKNILFKPCAHCGKVGWQYIGCNRIDNSKPHTKDNVEPCCFKCNNKLGCEYLKEILSKNVYQYTFDGELVKIWESVTECSKNGYDKAHVSACCRGERKTHKGFKWSYEPL